MFTDDDVNNAVAYAQGNDERIARLRTLFDSMFEGSLDQGDKARKSMTQASGNGKGFTFLVHLTKDDKMSVLRAALERLGEINLQRHTISFADFRCATR